MKMISQIDIHKNSGFLESRLQSFGGPGLYTQVVHGIKIHALMCGWVKVKNAHYHSGFGPYHVLFDPTWTDWNPIFSWVIEHPEGTIVIDTGETTLANGSAYLKNTGINGWFNRQISRFSIFEKCEVGPQLNLLGIGPENVRWVILSHLHVDHTGGLKYFPKSEIIVSHQEFIKPYGAVEQTHPKWFHPHLVDYFEDGGITFKDSYVLTNAKDVIIVPTPGHTFGHQSVILKTPEVNLFFAGDASFSYDQLKSDVVPGINVDRNASRKTLTKIREFCSEGPTVYLPSHDQKSVDRFFGIPVDINEIKPVASKHL